MNIEELAEQAGLAYKTPKGKYWIDAGYPDIHLERFAELVIAATLEQERKEAAEHYLRLIRDCVAKEREACAMLCLEQDEYGCGQYAAAIRARGEK